MKKPVKGAIYVALGEVGSEKNGGWAKGTDTPTKVVVTMLMGQLLQIAVETQRTAKEASHA